MTGVVLMLLSWAFSFTVDAMTDPWTSSDPEREDSRLLWLCAVKICVVLLAFALAGVR